MELLAGQPDQPISRATWGRALAGEEMTIVAPRGDPARERPSYEIRLGTLRDAAGKPIGAFQFAQDVTARLRDAAMLAQAQEALLQSQKLDSMGQLTGGVAHDFNNLLTPIVATLDLLQRRGIGSERERRLIHGAMQSAERAKTLVHRLLAFARRQPLQAVSVDVGALIRGLSDLLASTMGPQIGLEIEVAGDLPPAKADPGQLEMAIVNLCLNARDAMEGAGTIRIAAMPARRDAGQAPPPSPGAYVRVVVADTGQGMDEATRVRAIEPFFSSKGIGKGTGLGLSMAHGLASQLGGALTIESEVGVGTQVAIWLPESPDPAQSATAAQEADVGPRAGVAMVVEDEEYIRVSIVDMLTDLGFQVREASDAEAALLAIETGFRPDILITDHLMPGMTGMELARAVRARDPGMRVLIISGFAEADGIDPSFPRLTKPFVQSDLLRHIGGDVVRRPAEPTQN
jgi:signal transduction histidine kinase/CheY-like chemotaxis protein